MASGMIAGTKQMTRKQAHQAYSILIEEAGAPTDRRDLFVEAMIEPESVDVFVFLGPLGRTSFLNLETGRQLQSSRFSSSHQSIQSCHRRLESIGLRSR